MQHKSLFHKSQPSVTQELNVVHKIKQKRKNFTKLILNEEKSLF